MEKAGTFYTFYADRDNFIDYFKQVNETALLGLELRESNNPKVSPSFILSCEKDFLASMNEIGYFLIFSNKISGRKLDYDLLHALKVRPSVESPSASVVS